MSPIERLQPHLAAYLGPGAAGDLGPFTIYTNKNGKLVVFPRSPPKEPPTDKQVRQRNRFTMAIERWKLLPQPERTNWNRLAVALGVCATGHNLYVQLSLNDWSQSLATAITKTGITVSNPTLILP